MWLGKIILYLLNVDLYLDSHSDGFSSYLFSALGSSGLTSSAFLLVSNDGTSSGFIPISSYFLAASFSYAAF